MQQMSIFDLPAASPTISDPQTTAEKFWNFHRQNPQVFAALRDLALEARRRGDKEGIKSLYEVARWKLKRLQTAGDPVKLSNSYTGFYARLIMLLVPELEGFFDLRPMRQESRLQDVLSPQLAARLTEMEQRLMGDV